MSEPIWWDVAREAWAQRFGLSLAEWWIGEPHRHHNPARAADLREPGRLPFLRRFYGPDAERKALHDRVSP